MDAGSKIEQYRALKAEAQALLNDVGSSLVSLLDAPAEEQGHQNIDASIHGYFQAYYDLRTRHEQDGLEVAVLALTKSGKSTLINSFLGDELLPVNNVPETARIARITHAPSATCPQPLLEFTAPPASRSSSLASAASLDPPHPPTAGSSGSGSSSSQGGGGGGSKVVVAGAAAIREQLQQLNRDVRAREHLRSDEQVLDITAPLVVLESSSSSSSSNGGGSSDGSGSGGCDIKLCLLDTPGPNEAGEEGLKYQVERLLERVDAAIYLLDYTKLKTAEEAAVLGRLRAINPALVARLSSRLFFAVNKMDQADEAAGLDEEQTKEYVAEMVTRQLDCPEFKLHPDQVLLLSARNALLARLVLASKADPQNSSRFCRIAFGNFCNPCGSSSGGGGSSGGAARSPALMAAAAADMLEASGLPQLEERVLGFLFEAAAGVKLVATLDDVGRLLTQVSNVASSCRAALAASSSRLAASTAALQDELGCTLGEFDGVMEGTEELQVEVADELRAHLGNLRIRLFQFIADALDPAALQQRQQAAADAAAAAAATAAAAAAESGGRRHRRHRHGCCHSHHHRRRHHGHSHSSSSRSSGAGAGVFASATATGGFNGCSSSFAGGAGGGLECGSSDCDGSGDDIEQPAAAAAAAGGSSSSSGWWNVRRRFLSLFGGAAAAGGSESRDELSSALMDLSEELMGQIQADVTEAWHVMEGATNARAGRLITSLNAAIERLSARLEGAVNEALEIRLEPVSLRMAAPDACQFHADLSELIERGIGQQQERHIRSAERTDIVWEARRGVCRLTQFYVQVPRRRRIIETYTATTYSLLPAAVADHFMGVVDAAISATEGQLAGYVREYVRHQVEAARETVRQYGDRYIESLSAALETASQGADARAAALASVSAYCCSLEELRARLAALQARAELLVPHNSGAGCGAFEQLEFEGEEEEEAEQQEEGKQLQEEGAEGEKQQQQEETGQLQLLQQEEEAGEDGAASSFGGGAESAQLLEEGAAAVLTTAASAAAEQEEEEDKEVADGVAGSAGGSLDVGAAAAAAFGDARLSRRGSSSSGSSSGSLSSGMLVSAEDIAEARQAAGGDEQVLQMMRLPAINISDVSDGPSGTGDATAAAPAVEELDQETAPAAAAAAAAAAAGSGSGAADLLLPLSESDIAGAAPAAAAAGCDALLTADDVLGGLAVVSAAAVAAGSSNQQSDRAAAGGLADDGNTVDPNTAFNAAANDDDGVSLDNAAGCSGSSVPGLLPEEGGTAGSGSWSGIAGAQALPAQQQQQAGSRADGATRVSSHNDGDDGVPELLDACCEGGITASQEVDDALAPPVAVAPAAPAPLLPPVAAAAAGSSGFGTPGLHDDNDDDDNDDVPCLLDASEPPVSLVPLLPRVATHTAASPAAGDGAGGGGSSSSGGSLTPVSAVSCLGSPAASVASGSGTDCTAFSGMTAGTGFTQGSSNTLGSGFSRAQEALANSVLAAAAAGGPQAGSLAGSGLLMTGLAGSSSLASAGGGGRDHGSSSILVATMPPPLPVVAAGGGTGGAAADSASLDASLYASIVAHSEDNAEPRRQQPGSGVGGGASSGDGSIHSGSPFSNESFRQSFAAALTAAGLDGLAAGQSAPASGSPTETGSEDWQLVEPEEGQADADAAAAAGAKASAADAR